MAKSIFFAFVSLLMAVSIPFMIMEAIRTGEISLRHYHFDAVSDPVLFPIILGLHALTGLFCAFGPWMAYKQVKNDRAMRVRLEQRPRLDDPSRRSTNRQ